jgi:hypothetical protein
MKLKFIAAAVASLAAGSAFAIAPGSFDPLTIPQVYISGATAQNGGINNSIRLICQDGTLDAYATQKQVAYVCTVKTGSSLGVAYDGTAIAIHKESNGGSGNGINPLINGTTLAFVNLAPIVSGQTACTLDTISSVAASGSLAAENVWNCPTTQTVTQIPQVGFSDVDPAILGSNSSGVAGALSLYSPNQLTFGVAVSLPLYRALQTAQGLTADDAAANTPSLSNAQVQRLFQAAKVNTGDTLGITGDTKRIYPLRRGSTSGTQKTAETYFFNLNIQKGAFLVNTFINPTATYNSVAASLGYVAGVSAGGCGDATLAPAASTVFAGNANEEVVNCLNRHAAGNRYAVANITTEFNQFANPSSSSAAIDTNFPTGFRLVKLNGYLPTVENMVKGNYSYFSEQVITSLSTLAGTPAVVRDALNTELANPANLVVINNTFTKWTDLPVGSQTSGLVGPGRAASCKAKYSVTGTTPDSDPVSYLSKNSSGSTVVNAVPTGVAVCPPRF